MPNAIVNKETVVNQTTSWKDVFLSNIIIKIISKFYKVWPETKLKQI
jgi:hypothetical protein